MKLLIVSSDRLRSRIFNELDMSDWRIVVPSLYSSQWTSSEGGTVEYEVIKKFIPKFEAIYIEEGVKLESIKLLHHAIEQLKINEYHVCDFDSIDEVEVSLENCYFVDSSHSAAKKVEQRINSLFSGRLSKLVKSAIIDRRYAMYLKDSGFDRSQLHDLKKKWNEELKDFFLLLPTIAGLSWIVKAERAILEFDPKIVHRVYVSYHKDGIDFTAPHPSSFTDEYMQEKNDLISYLRDVKNEHRVNFYQAEVKSIKPSQKPIVLSYLQSKMFYLYEFSIDYTTRLAKKLYQAGLITNPSTASHYVPDEMAFRLIVMLNQKYGDEYVHQTPREYADQESETTAILPTKYASDYYPENVEKTPEFTMLRFSSSKEREDAEKLYGFIFHVTEWLQMKDALYDTSILQIKVGNKKLEARANVLAKQYNAETYRYEDQKNWKCVHQDLLTAINSASGEMQEREFDVVLPKCTYGEMLYATSVTSSAIKPKRPARYGVGRFNTQILGGKGIGTAESFHIIQNNLIDGNLVTLSNSMMFPTKAAIEAIDWIETNAPLFIEEKEISEYWARLDGIRFEGDDPEKLFLEYEYLISELEEKNGFLLGSEQRLTDAQIRYAKSVAIRKNIKIDNPKEFFNSAESVKELLDTYGKEDNGEEKKLFKCPVCRRGYVYERDFVDTDTGEVSTFYACEHQRCFSIYDNKIDEFFLKKGKDLDKEERIEALTNIASKQHLKKNGYLFTDFVSGKGEPYPAKVIIEPYAGKGNSLRYGLKLVF